MKRFTDTSFLGLVLCLALSAGLYAQEPDIMDVPPGYETLNIAISGDTTATGERNNPNRIYRLQRGGLYLLNGSIRSNPSMHLTVIANEGDGPRPILLPAADETGNSNTIFDSKGDATFKGLYFSGIDDLGNWVKNLIRTDAIGGRYVIDDCFFDYDYNAFIRMNAENQKLFITNSVMRNAGTANSNGQFMYTRGNVQDTIMIQNSTLYMANKRAIHDNGGYQSTIILDHNTFFDVASAGAPGFNVSRTVNFIVTNNLMINIGFEGDWWSSENDSVKESIIPIDSLQAPDLASEEERYYRIANNVYGWTPDLMAYFDSQDTLFTYDLLNVNDMWYIDTFPNMTAENNIQEYPVFSDPPADDDIIAWAQNNWLETPADLPLPILDRNGINSLMEDPASYGTAEDEFDFDYSTESQAYTHAEGGFPVGDLNWFPDKKAEWEAWVPTAVAKKPVSTPDRFSLEQNYPNPFNPSTHIAYQVHVPGRVNLSVYNMLGQKIKSLVHDEMQDAGSYEVRWDGQNDFGLLVSSGTYLYRLDSGSQTQLKKMVLLK